MMIQVMLRHVVHGFVILDNLPPGDTTIATQYDRITVSTTSRQGTMTIMPHSS